MKEINNIRMKIKIGLVLTNPINVKLNIYINDTKEKSHSYNIFYNFRYRNKV